MEKKLLELKMDQPIWGHFYMVAPLILVGTREGKHYNIAPKHMACPLGQDNYFGFVCTPRHHTYQNILREEKYTINFPTPDQVLMTSIAASPRCDDEYTRSLSRQLPVIKAPRMDAPFVKGCYLHLECTLHKIVDGFGEYSMIAGKISGAYLHPDYKRVSEADHQKMLYQYPLLSYLPDDRFAVVKETLAFPFPEGFKK